MLTTGTNGFGFEIAKLLIGCILLCDRILAANGLISLILFTTGSLITGSLITGSLLIGSLITGSLIIGSLLIGSLIIGCLLIGCLLIGCLLIVGCVFTDLIELALFIELLVGLLCSKRSISGLFSKLGFL